MEWLVRPQSPGQITEEWRVEVSGCDAEEGRPSAAWLDLHKRFGGGCSRLRPSWRPVRDGCLRRPGIKDSGIDDSRVGGIVHRQRFEAQHGLAQLNRVLRDDVR